jgi:hypothetical protein
MITFFAGGIDNFYRSSYIYIFPAIRGVLRDDRTQPDAIIK